MSIKIFKIDVDIYNYCFYICVGCPHKSVEFINEIQGFPNAEEKAYTVKDLTNYGGGVFTEENKPSVLWIPNIPKTPREHANLAHEIFHIVCDITRYISLPLSCTSEEAYCYLIGWVTKEFWSEVKK